MPRKPVSTKYRLQTFRWRTAWIKMFGAIHQHLRQYLIQNFSPHSRREGTITMIVLRCTGLHFLSNNYPPFRSMSNTFTIGKLISFICPVVSHFSWRAVKYMLKTQKSQHFSFLKMIPFCEPLSPNLPLLRRNLNTSQTKEQKRRSDWCEIHTLMRRSDWCEKHTLNDLIGASNIPLFVR